MKRPMTLRIAQISDTHMTRGPSMFQYNWEIVVEAIRDWAPDLVVCTGDIAMDGPNTPDDLVYAREQFNRLGAEVWAVPGNHDVGDVDVGHNRIDDHFIAQYAELFGPDFWVRERKGWILIGLNAQLPGSCLAGEHAQLEMLREALSIARGRPVAVFSHKALHLGVPDAEDPPGWTIPLPQRSALRDLLLQGKVRLYSSGNFHRYREMDDNGMRLLWAPSPAFITNHPKFERRGGLVKCGFVRIELGPEGSVTTAFADDNAMVQFDIQNALNDGGARRKEWSERLSLQVTRIDA